MSDSSTATRMAAKAISSGGSMRQTGVHWWQSRFDTHTRYTLTKGVTVVWRSHEGGVSAFKV